MANHFEQWLASVPPAVQTIVRTNLDVSQLARVYADFDMDAMFDEVAGLLLPVDTLRMYGAEATVTPKRPPPVVVKAAKKRLTIVIENDGAADEPEVWAPLRSPRRVVKRRHLKPRERSPGRGEHHDDRPREYSPRRRQHDVSDRSWRRRREPHQQDHLGRHVERRS